MNTASWLRDETEVVATAMFYSGFLPDKCGIFVQREIYLGLHLYGVRVSNRATEMTAPPCEREAAGIPSKAN
jgi:hypothetical protein